MDFLCSNLVKTIFTYWIGTVFNLILQLADENDFLVKISQSCVVNPNNIFEKDHNIS